MRAFGDLDEVTSSIWSATRASFLPSNLKTFAITSWACAPPGAKLRTSGSTFLSVPQSGSARAISAALAGELSSGDNQRCASVAQSFVDQAAQRMSRRADEIPTEAHRRFGKCDQFSPSCVPADPAAPSTAGIWQTSRAECVGCAPVAGRAARSRKCANVAGSASPASSCIHSVFAKRDSRYVATSVVLPTPGGPATQMPDIAAMASSLENSRSRANTRPSRGGISLPSAERLLRGTTVGMPE